MDKIHKEPVLYRTLKPVASALFSLVFLPKVKGKENIPKDRSAVLAGNHTKSLDCFMVMAGTKRSIHFLAKAELFGNPFTNKFFKAAGLIPVHRDRKDPDSLRDAKEYLNNGCLIGIFPEGRVNKTDEELLDFKIGAVKMAHDTNSPIVPFTINGKYRPFGKPEIIFQEPFYIESDDLDVENNKLKEKIRINLRNRCFDGK